MKTTLHFKSALIASVLILATSALAGKHGQKRGAPARAQAMVAKVVALFDKAAFDRFTNRPGREFRHSGLYIFVGRAEGSARIVAHGVDRSLIGTNATTLIDPGGLNIGRAFLEKATAKGTWVDYGWKDPLTGRVVPKSSWVVLHKGCILGKAAAASTSRESKLSGTGGIAGGPGFFLIPDRRAPG